MQCMVDLLGGGILKNMEHFYEYPYYRSVLIALSHSPSLPKVVVLHPPIRFALQ